MKRSQDFFILRNPHILDFNGLSWTYTKPQKKRNASFLNGRQTWMIMFWSFNCFYNLRFFCSVYLFQTINLTLYYLSCSQLTLIKSHKHGVVGWFRCMHTECWSDSTPLGLVHLLLLQSSVHPKSEISPVSLLVHVWRSGLDLVFSNQCWS